MTKPKILFFDIETAPLLGYVWGLWNNDIALNQLKTDWSILSWSAKWRGKNRIYYADQRKAKNLQDERLILRPLCDLINEADIIVTHNGKRFDVRKINARLIALNMKPLAPVKHIDTKEISARNFGFTSNKLEYLAKYLGVKLHKSEHNKFPGFSLWEACLNGNQSAWAEMEKYNRRDTLVLEQVFEKLLPWTNTVNFDVFHDKLEHKCSCGSKDYRKFGMGYTSTGKYQRYQCKDCGKVTRGHKNLLDKDKRKSIHRRA